MIGLTQTIDGVPFVETAPNINVTIRLMSETVLKITRSVMFVDGHFQVTAADQFRQNNVVSNQHTKE